LAALAMQAMWEGGRLPRVEDWFARVQSRPTFAPAFVRWLPAALGAQMRENGQRSWPAVAGLLGI
jgi:glutathione S-transferase